jgi:hypothetical protein
MLQSLKLRTIKLPAVSIREPRVAMRVLVWTLVALNLVAALIAFGPLGSGSSEELRSQESSLRGQLAALQKSLDAGKGLISRVEAARRGGDDFFVKYVMDARAFASTLNEELNRSAKDAGIVSTGAQTQTELIEGSDTLSLAEITANYQGTYSGLKKFVELLDKSPRFLIIENMNVASPPNQSGQVVTVTMKFDVFFRNEPGASL